MSVNLPPGMPSSISPSSPRLFVAAPLHERAEIEASAAQAHYLGRVMRRVPGDSVRLFNGIDGEWCGRIAAIRRERARLAVDCLLRAQTPEPDLWLAFAPLKRDATELVVQKATELGVSVIQPVLTERTNAARVNVERLAAIAIEAAEQCERLTVPRLLHPVRLRDMLASWPADRVLVVAVERSDADPLRPVAASAALLVGPEGGFSTTELDAMRAYAFVLPRSLGPRILRAETAAIVGLALLQAPAGN
jgi:16S rRNA (uracil1498-N3)-methyltransferase